MRTPAAAIRRLLLVLAVVILALYAIVAAITRPVAGDAATYRAEFTDVFGLRENADVRVRGVQVGKVKTIDVQRSGTALVTFTVRDSDRLRDGDHLAIRFQNLVGQRYLGIVDESPPAAAALDPQRLIPLAQTTGSFDITTLFNGLRPILQGADPAVFNTLAQNLIDLIQGEDGVGLGEVLGDIETLAQFATDRNAMIRVIIDNLGGISTQLQGKASILATLMDNMTMLFDTLEVNLELLKGAFGEGSKVFPPIVEVMKHAFDLGLGGHDNISARLLELIPDTDRLTEVMSTVPSLLATLNAQMDQLNLVTSCSKGELPLPAAGEALLGGGKVTLCNR